MLLTTAENKSIYQSAVDNLKLSAAVDKRINKCVVFVSMQYQWLLKVASNSF